MGLGFENGKLTLIQECPMCRTAHSMQFTEAEHDNVLLYYSGFGLIQNLLPDLNPDEREFLVSGYCPKCQKLLFGCCDTDRIQVVA